MLCLAVMILVISPPPPGRAVPLVLKNNFSCFHSFFFLLFCKMCVHGMHRGGFFLNVRQIILTFSFSTLRPRGVCTINSCVALFEDFFQIRKERENIKKKDKRKGISEL